MLKNTDHIFYINMETLYCTNVSLSNHRTDRMNGDARIPSVKGLGSRTGG